MTEIVKVVNKENYEFFSTDDISFSERLRLTNWIHATLPYVKIKRIEKVRNEHLYSAFQLKKKELGNCTVTELLHSTAAWNIPSIVNSSLHWRLVNRSKYGVGTSFSKNADYADFYGSWSGGTSRAFVVCDVLLKNKPYKFTDYYQSTNGHVHVKFDDFTYYPKYVLYYDKPPQTKSALYRPIRFASISSDDVFNVNWAEFDAMFDKLLGLHF